MSGTATKEIPGVIDTDAVDDLADRLEAIELADRLRAIEGSLKLLGINSRTSNPHAQSRDLDL